jgi:hypothetical protein
MNGMIRKLLVVIIGLIATIVLFRSSVFSHFRVISGGGYDPIIAINIFEHWYHVFSGTEHWNTVAYFAPYSDTLGYNDGYFLYSIIYSFFRLMNFDPFLSSECLLLTLSLIGYLSFYALARYLKYSCFLSVMAALIFIFSNNLQIHANHIQLFSLFFTPFVCLFLLKFFQALKENLTLRAIYYGAIVTFSYGLWLFTAYYMAWFAGFFTTIFLIIWVIYHRAAIKNYMRWIPIVITGCLFIIFILPFLIVYLPKLSETGGQSLAIATKYAIGLSTLFNVGHENLLFGGFYTKLLSFIPINNEYELMVGFSYLSLILVIAAIISNIKNRRNIVLSMAFIVAIFLMFRIGTFPLWKIVYWTIPGAKGMRVVSRFAIFLNFPMVLLLLDFFSRMGSRNRAAKALSVFLIVLTLVSNVNSVYAGVNRQDKINLYKSFPPIPSDCKVFFVLPKHLHYTKDTVLLNLYDHNVDAMFLAEKYGVRTVNGYSTFNPPTWDFSAYPFDTYKQRVYQYLMLNKMNAGICSLDLDSTEWDLSPITRKKIELYNKYFILHPSYEHLWEPDPTQKNPKLMWSDSSDSKMSIVNYSNKSYSIKFTTEIFRPNATQDIYIDISTSQGYHHRYVFQQPKIQISLNVKLAAGEELILGLHTNGDKLVDVPNKINNSKKYTHLYFLLINPIVTIL